MFSGIRMRIMGSQQFVYICQSKIIEGVPRYFVKQSSTLSRSFKPTILSYLFQKRRNVRSQNRPLSHVQYDEVYQVVFRYKHGADQTVIPEAPFIYQRFSNRFSYHSCIELLQPKLICEVSSLRINSFTKAEVSFVKLLLIIQQHKCNMDLLSEDILPSSRQENGLIK